VKIIEHSCLNVVEQVKIGRKGVLAVRTFVVHQKRELI
jgi:hypothetical protein